MNTDTHLNASTYPWQIISIKDYEIPNDPRTSLLEKPWQKVTNLFSSNKPKTDINEAETDLRELPHVQLANLVPAIHWASATSALTLSGDNENDINDMPRFLVGQPFCDHAAILQHWAQENQAVIINLPDISQILMGDTHWLESFPSHSKGPWVLPALERCFFRHTRGLELLRRFLELAHSGSIGPGMIGCDSWAFAFIQRIWPLPDSSPLTLQSFNGHALESFFIQLKNSTDKTSKTRFYSAQSGNPILLEQNGRSMSLKSDLTEDKQTKILPELRQLAAHCRGNPGLAWHYWRKKLRSNTGSGQHNDKDSKSGEDIVWVLPNIESPSLPTEASEDVAFIMHSLLIHRGLSVDLLAHLLPIPRSRIVSQLLRMKALSLVIPMENTWNIAPLAYPLVRDFLKERHYLIDPF